MKKIAHLALAAVTAMSLVGLASTAAEAAPRWHCSGKEMKRCISKSGTKVKIRFTNTTNRSAKGMFGFTCFGSDGQHVKVTKDGRLAGHDTITSSWHPCPKGHRASADAWFMSSSTGKVFRSPGVNF